MRIYFIYKFRQLYIYRLTPGGHNINSWPLLSNNHHEKSKINSRRDKANTRMMAIPVQRFHRKQTIAHKYLHIKCTSLEDKLMVK